MILSEVHLEADTNVLTNREVIDRLYICYVLLTAYNRLVADFPELGWKSKHSAASKELFEQFSQIDESVTLARAALSDRALPPLKLGHPVIEEAIIDIQIAFLRDKIVTAEQALDYIPFLKDNHPALVNLEQRVSKNHPSVLVLMNPVVRRPRTLPAHRKAA